VGHVTCTGHLRETKNFSGKLVTRRTYKDNIEMVLKGVESEGMHWIFLRQGRDRWQTFMNTVIYSGFFKGQGIS
jgi:hypothetical protein